MTTSRANQILNDEYCNAPHENVPLGCYGKPNHEGQHWAWATACEDDSLATQDTSYPFDYRFRWDEPLVEFTPAELKIILTLLQPVKQFFPELQAKVEKASK